MTGYVNEFESLNSCMCNVLSKLYFMIYADFGSGLIIVGKLDSFLRLGKNPDAVKLLTQSYYV